MNAPRDLLSHPFATQLGLHVAGGKKKARLTEARQPKPGVGKNPGSAPVAPTGEAPSHAKAPAAVGRAAAGAATSRRQTPYFAVDSTGQLVIYVGSYTEPVLLSPTEHHALRAFLNLNQGVAK